ncbi:unnamed protein product [Microthlaspi erraticum]|uniref:Uncharacterized protein n=1 Tax=Microthlaspi erraticum TaxID=1685480 RepID=A0A6D2KQK9_9BRAS|nr:unnamed protein product [Microthlaspi erraticum]
MFDSFPQRDVDVSVCFTVSQGRETVFAVLDFSSLPSADSDIRDDEELSETTKRLLKTASPAHLFLAFSSWLSKRTGLSKDDATTLLLKYKWDEDLIVQKWNTAGNDVISRTGIIFPSLFAPLEEEVPCAQCQSPSVCKNFGCDHLICNRCTKGIYLCFPLLSFFFLYVEEKISEGELNIKCPLFYCNKVMASSRFLDEVSADHKNLFREGLTGNYNASKIKKDVVNSFDGFAAAFHSGLGLVTGFVARIWSNKWRAVSTLLLLFVFCRLFYGCTGATLQCVAELSILNILAMTAKIGSILKLFFLYLLLKIALNNHVFTVAVLSSVATCIFIFLVIAKVISSCVRVVARTFT